MIKDAKGIYIKPLSPRVLAKFKKGMKCRVCAGMKGKGAYLEVHPERFNHITRSFLKGTGIHIELTPEEIAHNHGKGFFDDMSNAFKSAGNWVNDSVIQPAVNAVVPLAQQAASAIVPVAKEAGKRLLPVAKEAGNALIDAGINYAPELGATALTGLALAAGQPELIPLAGMAGQYLGREGGKALGNIARQKVNDFDPYASNAPRANEPPSRKTQVVNDYNPYEELNAINTYTGQKMGNLQKSNMESYLANLSLGQVEDLLNRKRQSMRTSTMPMFDYSGGRAILSPYADPVPTFQGYGLYAGSGHGLSGGAVRKQRPRREMSSIGIHGNLLGAHLPPALVSQPYSANFQFGSRLPPAYQKFAKSGQGLYA